MKIKRINNIKILLLIASLILMVLLGGCVSKENDKNEVNEIKKNSENTQKKNDVEFVEVIDQIGRKVRVKSQAPKIVSTYYISSAIIIALDRDENLVGVEKKASRRELYKKVAKHILDLPAVGSGKGINIEEIASLSPDVVIIPKKLKDDIQSLEALNIPVVVIDPENLDDFLYAIEILGDVSGSAKRADELISYYRQKIDELIKLDKSSDKPSVYFSSNSSYFSTTTKNMYQNYIIDIAGGVNVSQELDDAYWKEVSAEQLVKWKPEYMFYVNDAKYTKDDIINDERLSGIPAIKNLKVYRFPSSIEPWDYPTTSSILGMMYMTYVLHPEAYTKEEYVKEAKEFYSRFFELEVTDEELGIN